MSGFFSDFVFLRYWFPGVLQHPLRSLWWSWTNIFAGVSAVPLEVVLHRFCRLSSDDHVGKWLSSLCLKQLAVLSNQSSSSRKCESIFVLGIFGKFNSWFLKNFGCYCRFLFLWRKLDSFPKSYLWSNPIHSFSRNNILVQFHLRWRETRKKSEEVSKCCVWGCSFDKVNLIPSSAVWRYSVKSFFLDWSLNYFS